MLEFVPGVPLKPDPSKSNIPETAVNLRVPSKDIAVSSE